MRSVLLTGGSGFFGKSILDALHRGVLDIFGIRRMTVVARRANRLRAEAPELCGDRIELVESDVLSLDSLFDADIVIHAAASADIPRYGADPVGEARIVVDGARRVWELAARARRGPRMLLVSSGAVYGRQPAGQVSMNEQTAPRPDGDPARRAYAAAKREAETTVIGLASRAGLPTRIARCFAFVGPWLPLGASFAVGNFLQCALRGEPIRVHALHPVVRSYLHADDLAFWLMALATADGADIGEAYNVGSPEEVSIRDLARSIASIAGVGVLLPDENAGPAASTPEAADRYVPDVSKVQRKFGLSVTIPVRQAIESTFRALADGTNRNAAGERPSRTQAPARASGASGD
jgi:dTDP-glucose 4,6-dehydratase